MATNICPKCKAKIREGAEYCPECGKPTFDKCPKCDAKLNKNNNFCIKCGFKIRKPLTFASNSLIGGIIALFIGWLPIIGWVLIILALIYGFLSLKRIEKGNTLENRKVAIAGIVLGFIALAIALAVIIYWVHLTNAPKSGASATNENGMIIIRVLGEDVPLRFVDDITGLPVSGLSVGYAIYPPEGMGAFVVIDPKYRFTPQIVLLEGSETNEITGYATSEQEIGIVKNVFITKESATVVQTIKLEQLKKAIGTMQDVTSAIVLAAKVLDQSGLPVGKYVGELSIAKKRTISQEEAYVENSIKNKLKEKLIFLAGESVLTNKGVIPNLNPVSVSLDVANFIFDQSAISSCGAPNEKVSVTEIAGIVILGCEYMYISDYIPQVMTVYIEGKDQYGLDLSNEDSTKLVKGSVDFVSKSNIGFGTQFEVNINEDLKVEVPEGNYATRITSPGFATSTPNVNKRGANLRPTLKPLEIVSQNGPLIFEGETLPSATVGEPYSWSLCRPELRLTSDLCGAFIQTTNPIGGLPPYHFQPDIMGGFPPFGINWNLNGMLTGTPTIEGQRTFRMCAVDMAGSQSCQTFILNVEKESEKPVSGSGECEASGRLSCSSPMYCCFPLDIMNNQKFEKGYLCIYDKDLPFGCFSSAERARNEAKAIGIECEQIITCGEEPEEPEKPSGNGCFCSFTNEPCTKNSDCPPDRSIPDLPVPGFCACPA